MSKVFTITEGLENMGALRTGGQGSVYKGKRIGPIVSAVKLLPTPIHSESLEDRNYRNFINEVEKLKKVNENPNPNVVKILNSGITESGSLPFIEMEFIEGPDLEELLKPPHEAIFTIKEVVKLADQLSGALAHCHKVGVKHGDIKSNNIKFNVHSGNYVLLDFGLSIMSDEQRRSSTRHAGAIEFMAPEQSDGTMLFSTDVYSYGVVLYELLAGQVPFPLRDNGETARNNVMLAHRENKIPDLLAVRKEKLPVLWNKTVQEREMQVPGWLLRLITKCLEKAPDKRYKNGMELYNALAEHSLAEDQDITVSETIATLRSENRELKAAAADREKGERSKISISRPFFIALIGLLVFVTAFSFFRKPVAVGRLGNAVQDTMLSKTRLQALLATELQLKAEKIRHHRDSLVRDSFRKDSIKKAKAALLHPVKKKRKKFLGIF